MVDSNRVPSPRARKFRAEVSGSNKKRGGCGGLVVAENLCFFFMVLGKLVVVFS